MSRKCFYFLFLPSERIEELTRMSQGDSVLKGRTAINKTKEPKTELILKTRLHCTKETSLSAVIAFYLPKRNPLCCLWFFQCQSLKKMSVSLRTFNVERGFLVPNCENTSNLFDDSWSSIQKESWGWVILFFHMKDVQCYFSRIVLLERDKYSSFPLHQRSSARSKKRSVAAASLHWWSFVQSSVLRIREKEPYVQVCLKSWRLYFLRIWGKRVCHSFLSNGLSFSISSFDIAFCEQYSSDANCLSYWMTLNNFSFKTKIPDNIEEKEAVERETRRRHSKCSKFSIWISWSLRALVFPVRVIFPFDMKYELWISLWNWTVLTCGFVSTETFLLHHFTLGFA